MSDDTGLIPSPVQLKAKWIWGTDKSPNTYCYFRRVFRYPASPGPYELRVGADSRYILWVNGRLVGRGPVPGTSSWKIVDPYDISRFLIPGENVVCALVHHVGRETSSMYRSGSPGLIVEARDGQADVFLSTDKTWKVYPGNPWGKDVQFHWGLGYSEMFDSRRGPRGWLEKGYDYSSWKSACVTAGARPGLFKRIIEPICEKVIAPLRIAGAGCAMEDSGPEFETRRGDLSKFMNEEKLVPSEKAAARFRGILGGKTIDLAGLCGKERGVFVTLDFGRDMAACPELEFNGPAGMAVDMAWAEALKPAGDSYGYHRKFFQANKYISTEGRNHWRCFNYRGFRYLHLVFRKASPHVKIQRISCDSRSLPACQEAAFECSDPVLNKIWEMGQYTVRLCRQETFIDCVIREQAQATGDTRLVAQFAHCLFGDDSLWRQFLWQVARSQNDEGLVETYYPGYSPAKLLDYCLHWIGSLWEHYQLTGTDALLREYYPNMCRLIRWFEKKLGPSGTLEGIECGALAEYVQLGGYLHHQVFIDHPGIFWSSFPHPGISRYGNLAALDMFFLEAVEIMEAVSALLARGKEAIHFRRLFRVVRKGIQNRYWLKKEGVFCDGFHKGVQVKNISQQTNALALYLGLVRKDRVKHVVDVMLDTENPGLCLCTPYFWYYLFRGLSRNGCYERGFPFIKRRWKPMLDPSSSGAFWELFSDEHSLCHAWSATPVFELMTEVLGVKPASPGYNRVSISPKACGLKWARGSVATPKGLVKVTWESGKRKLDVTHELPEGVKIQLGGH